MRFRDESTDLPGFISIPKKSDIKMKAYQTENCHLGPHTPRAPPARPNHCTPSLYPNPHIPYPRQNRPHGPLRWTPPDLNPRKGSPRSGRLVLLLWSNRTYVRDLHGQNSPHPGRLLRFPHLCCHLRRVCQRRRPAQSNAASHPSPPAGNAESLI